MARIGFIGLGAMGLSMALNLVRGGHLVSGYDVNPDQLAEFAEKGGNPCPTAIGAVDGAEFVITMLPDGTVVEDVMIGRDGVAAAMSPGALHIDMSTILASESDAVRQAMAVAGLEMIDAPVGRTATEAASGKLLIMVGATDKQLERARPIFECMGDTIVHCGAPGMGIRMKLVNNYMTTVSNVVTAEALTLAERSGISVDTALEVMRGTAAGRGHMNTTYPDKVLRGDVTPGFMIALARKDLKLGIATGEMSGIHLATGLAALEAYDFAVETKHGSEDWTAMLKIVPDIK